MAAIDVGGLAINRGSADIADYTFICTENPADGTGTLDTMKAWAHLTITGFRAGTFYGTPPTFTSRDSAYLGGVSAGSEQTFTGLSIDVQSGDYVGEFHPNGQLEKDSSGGAGAYYKYEDQFGAGSQTYTEMADDILSLYGTGETAGGISIPVVMHHLKQQEIS